MPSRKLELREEIPKTGDAACHICTATGPAKTCRDSATDPRRGKPPSCARRTPEGWTRRHPGKWGQAEHSSRARMRLGEKTQVQEWGGLGLREKDNLPEPLRVGCPKPVWLSAQQPPQRVHPDS